LKTLGRKNRRTVEDIDKNDRKLIGRVILGGCKNEIGPENLSMKSVLVTGGAGFIGSHTVVELVNAGFRPIILDDFSNADDRVLFGLEQILGTHVKVYRLNCLDRIALERILSEEEIDSVIHFAAFKAVGESVENPLRYYHNNIGSLIALLEAMKNQSVQKIVFSSSCTVYGQPDKLPVTEESPILPAASPYGYTKQVCEQLIIDSSHAYPELKAVILRYFNPIGAHPSGLIGELPFGKPNNLVPFITQTSAGMLPELMVHGNDYSTPDGSCIRDYIHVCDLAAAHVRALEWQAKTNVSCEVFNLGQGYGHSVLEVIKAFTEVTGRTFPYKIGPRRPGDIEQIWADTTKVNSVLGWKTAYSLKDGLKDAWRWQENLMENND
jgi:UDP-glucose 4-epimerase